MIDKWVLVDYIKSQSFKQNKIQITPIKLQKSLYFLYAMWAGFANQKNGEVQVPQSDVELFDADFTAWAFGPVDVEVYEDFKVLQKVNNTQHRALLKKQATTLQLDFIEQTLPRILNTSDFGLVDLSHRDKCWVNHFTPAKDGKPSIGLRIPNQSIIDEYTNKFGQ